MMPTVGEYARLNVQGEAQSAAVERYLLAIGIVPLSAGE